MSRRVLGVFALPLLAALVAVWLWRARAAGIVELPREVADEASAPMLPDTTDPEHDRSSTREKVDGLFQSLASAPGELLVQFRDGQTLAAIPHAEVSVLEGAEPGWPRWEQRSDEPPLDLEAQLRSRGRHAASDEHGDLRLANPRFPLRLIARKDERFGAACIGIEDERPVAVWMYTSAACTVHVRDPQGLPVPLAPIEVGSRSTDEIWRGSCDAAGECRIPNLGWLLRRFGPDEGWGYATVEGSRAAAAISWFRVEESLPSTIDLVLAPGLQLRIAASDGTPVPIAGSLCVLPPALAGQGRAPSPRMNPWRLPIVRGECSLELGEPGSWIDCAVQLAEGVDFLREVRTPEPGAAQSILLRVPADVQILLAHAVDERGEPLRTAKCEWITHARTPADGLEHELLVDPLETDVDGLLAFAVPQKLFADNHWSDPRGTLRLRDGARELEAPPLLLSNLKGGALRDVGKLVLGPAQVFARGRIVDDVGQPIPGVLVRLRGVTQGSGDASIQPVMLKDARAQTTTDAEGRFEFFGEPLEARYLVQPWISGYSIPREATPLVFAPGSGTDLSITLVRDGEVRVCVDLPRRLVRELYWNLSNDSGHGASMQLGPRDGSGRIERDIRNVPPGEYRARLVDGIREGVVLAEIEGVRVRPGERTNDPRLCGIDLSRAEALSDSRPEAEAPAGAIVLDVLDANGRPIREGRISPTGLTRDGDAFWHAGRLVLDASAGGKEIALCSPGFRVWIGACPAASTSLRLEPAPRLTLRVEIPPAMLRPDCRFRIWPQPAGGSNLAMELLRGLAPVELDAQGSASFDCPLECTVRFIVQVLALDPSGNALREGSVPEPVTSLDVLLPAVSEERLVPVLPEEWAAVERILGR